MATKIDNPAPAESVVRSAGMVSGAMAMSRVTGLLREIVMARLFGAGFVYDAFLLGFRIPNLTRDLFAEGALSSAFVPIFTQTLEQKGRKEAALLSNLVATALIIVVGLFCLLGIVFTPAWVNLLASGFHQVPGKFELAVKLTRIMFAFLLLVALAAQAMGVLNACNRFAVPALASTFFNIGSVAFGLILGYLLGPHLGIDPITGMAIGVVLGGALQLVWQLPSLRAEGFRFRPAIDWDHPLLRKIFRLMGPAILGNAAVQINVLVITNFASRIPGNGPVSWLGYSFRFMQLPLGLFGVAIASATLPSISRSAGIGDFDEFRRTLSKSLGMVFLLTLPSSVGLIVLGRTMIGAIYQGGKFSAYRHRADRARALLLRFGTGRILRAQSAQSRLLRAARCAHPHDRQPALHRGELFHRQPAVSLLRLGTRRSRAFHRRGGHFRRRGAVRDSSQSHARHLRPQSNREHLENCRRVRRHGCGCFSFQPSDRRLAGRRPPGAFGGSGHARFPLGLLVFYAACRVPARQRTGAGHPRLISR